MTICENGTVVSLKAVVDDGPGHLGEDLFLSNIGWKYLVKGKLVVILCIGKFGS